MSMVQLFKKMILVLFAVFLAQTALHSVFAGITVETGEHRTLELTIGKSITLKSSRTIARVSIADPNVADFISITPAEIYVTGKAPGKTNLTLWEGDKISAIYDLNVVYDVSRLKQKLNSLLPNERDIRVMAFDDSLTLAGRISSSSNLSQALAIAEGFAPKGKVRNLLEVSGVHQVMLEVRVAEISRSLTRRLALNYIYSNAAGEFAIGTLGQVAGFSSSSGGGGSPIKIGDLELNVSSSSNALFRFNRGNATWTNVIDALKDDGLIKVLAEPTLIALSGQTANFLAGGEFPVPVPQGLGTVAIEYKSFGVGLKFTPTVLDENKISMQVTPEVSDLDFSTAVQFAGFVVPGLIMRRASTTVELADGQSFAIAGLLNNSVRESVAKYPGLGDIPILGMLFRSSSYRKNETELVIIVTPHLVKPLDMKKQSLPTDYFIEPNDIEFYLWGLMEGKGKNKSSMARGQFDGDFGYAIPLSK